MQVETLTIERRPSYDSGYPNQLVGVVSMKSPTVRQEIRLSNKAIADIFKIISSEVSETAKRNASNTARGMENASEEARVLENSKVEVLS